jgi:putative colanic acid biosynthesis UDP-glucose lipid carrier transferase
VRSSPGIAPLLDPLLVGIAAWLAYVLRWQDPLLSQAHYRFAILLGMLLAPAVLHAAGVYRPAMTSRRGDLLLGLGGATLILAALLALLSVLTKTSADFSRLWMAAWLLFSILLLGASRQAQAWLHARPASRAGATPVLLCGNPAYAGRFLESLGDGGDIEPLGFLAPDADDHEAAPPGLAVLPWHAAMSAAEISHVTAGAEEIWLFAGGDGDQSLLDMLLRGTSLPVRYFPPRHVAELLRHPVRTVAGVASIEIHATPLDRSGRLQKAFLDRSLAAVGLLLLFPVLLVLASLVLLDAGRPVLFRQPRHGAGGRVFQMLKFRTMHRSADTGVQAVRDDPRMTRLGRLLRRYSLDELPQLINVLRGEMSLVGPRPHPVDLNDRYLREVDALMQRHRLKPGITGWAQINGYRGATETRAEMAARIEHDIYYLEHWSLWFDLRILLVSLVRGWSGENAY